MASWSFHYQGLRDRADIRLCLTCAAASEKKCTMPNRPHGGNVSCPGCTAAQTGVCDSHRGVESWVAAAAIPEPVKGFILARIEDMPVTKQVLVHAYGERADEDDEDSHPETLHIEVTALKAGAAEPGVV